MMSVSAIVSAYFAEPYLEKRLQNLLAQSLLPEIVIVCQRDSFEHRTAEAFGKQSDKIVIVLTADIPTVYAAWNMGIQASSGEYITNANSDDLLYPGALRKLAEVLDGNKNIAVAYFDVDVVTEYGGQPVGRYEWLEGGITELLTGCFVGPMPMWRKSLHDKYGMFDAEMYSAGDYEFWLRLAKSGERFKRVRQALGAYLNRDDSAEHRHKLRSLWEQARAKGRYREGVGIWLTPEPMTD